jgi:hypothetical protein
MVMCFAWIWNIRTDVVGFAADGWSQLVYIFVIPDHPGAIGLASVRATPPVSVGETFGAHREFPVL